MLIEKYSSNWIKNFADLKREIDNELHGLDYRIEHVGSTSVPNLDAKPIIDMDIIYSHQADFEKIKSKLEKIISISIIGFASKFGTEVLPTCSIR